MQKVHQKTPRRIERFAGRATHHFAEHAYSVSDVGPSLSRENRAPKSADERHVQPMSDGLTGRSALVASAFSMSEAKYSPLARALSGKRSERHLGDICGSWTHPLLAAISTFSRSETGPKFSAFQRYARAAVKSA
eukprot:6204584-Pleurochrysis_carterae.AAC.1